MTPLEALEKRGYTVLLRPDGRLSIKPSLTPVLRPQVEKRREEIVIELLRRHGIDPAADPRPDLEEDSVLWARLLADLQTPVLELLHGLRCSGARIELSATEYHITGSYPEFESDCKLLQPHGGMRNVQQRLADLMSDTIRQQTLPGCF